MVKPLVIKIAMLVATAALIAWIGWPTPLPITEDPVEPVQEMFAKPEASAQRTDRRPMRLATPTSRDSRPDPAGTISRKLDINRATMEQLQTLPGIGTVLAQRMIDRRTKRGPFLTIDELRTVKGIGAKRLEQLRPLVMAGPVDTSSQTIHPTGRRFSDKAAL